MCPIIASLMKFWMNACFLNARNCHADNIELNFKVMRKCALELSFGIACLNEKKGINLQT